MAAKKTSSATLNEFPPDTKVAVFEKTGDSFDGGGRGKAVERVQVGTDGSLVLTGLDRETEYWACGDTGLVVAFIAVDPDPGKIEGRAAQTSAGDDTKRASSTPGPEEENRPSGGAIPISATQQGGSGRSTSADDAELVETKPKKTKKSSGRKAPAKKSSGTRKAGRKGVRGARGTVSSR